jgi:hypothetical protein
MAILGEAHIIVRAITDGVENDIKRAFDQSGANDAMRRNSKAMKGNAMEALKASQAFTKLNRVGMLMQGIIGALAGGITALVSGGLIPLIAALGQAATAGVVLVSTFAAIKVGSMVAKSAMKGIGQAVSAASTGNSAYAKTLREVREEMQQLAFDAEDAALGEKRAAMNLERAREELMRVQDLPPNDRARREAELAYEEADLAFRRAKDRNSDMAEEMANARKRGTASGGGAGTDPFKDLTASQKVFAQYLVTIQGKMKELREAAASGFLPLLQTQIERIMKGPAFDNLLKGYNTVGVALGEAAKNFVDALTKGNNLQNLKEFFRQTAKILPKLGTVLGNLFGAFLSVMKAAEPLTLRFLTWLIDVTGRMDRLAAVGANSGRLSAFFKKAGDQAAQLSGILKNFAMGIGASFGASVGPGSGGQMLLDYLDRAAKRYKDARQSFSGRLLSRENFKESATSFIEISRALGKIGGAFKGLGAGAGGFFTELARSAPSIKTILRSSVDTGKAFGRLTAKVIDFIAVFADAAQVNIFFETLTVAVKGATDLIKLIPGPVIAALGVVFGLVSAIGLIGKTAKGVGLIFKGFAIQTVILGAKMRGLTINQAVATTGFKKLGITAEVAGKQMQRSMASNVILLALSLVVGAVMAISDATEKVNEGLRDTASAALEAGDSGEKAFKKMFAGNTEMQRMSGNAENLVKSLRKIREHNKKTTGTAGDIVARPYTGFQWWDVSTWNPNADSVVLANTLNNVKEFGKTLAEIAASDVEKAQRSFKELATSAGKSRQDMALMLTNMPELREALVKQADALGINIRNLDGTVNGAKQLDFALGNGEIAIRRAADAALEFQKKISGAAAEMINFGDAVQQNTDEKTKKVNVAGLIKTLAKQAEDAAAYQMNLLKLKGRGVGQPVIDAIIGSGAAEGSAAAAALANATDEQLNILKAQYAEVGRLSGDEMAAKLQQAGPAINGVMKQLGSKSRDAFIASLLEGQSIQNAMKEIVTQLNTSQSRLIYSADAAGNLHAKDSKTGKYVFAKGGLVEPRRLSVGSRNPLQGFGGPQADTIPAYLSAGEFVMNASAVSRFLPTLQAMNQTSFSNNRLNSTVPSAQAPTPPSSNVSIVVNPAPGMNETELAQKVAVEMARQMRQGTF